MYTVGSLFSGIGGIDLAFSREGFDIRWQVEIDPFCRQVLAKHSDRWPNAEVHEDVHGVGKHNLTAVDVMAGGFPCQDISEAGRGAGIKKGTRSGLWFEFARIIGELRPRFVFLENVAAITRRDGAIVLGCLTEMGYDAEWGIIPAAAAGAAHQRDRWWCVAYSQFAQWRKDDQREGYSEREQLVLSEGPEAPGRFEICREAVGHTDGIRWQQEFPSNTNGVAVGNIQMGHSNGQSEGYRQYGAQQVLPYPTAQNEAIGQALPDAIERRSKSVLGRTVNGLPRRLDSATVIAPPGQEQYPWEAPRTAPRKLLGRSSRLKALGNAVYVPLVQVFAAAIRQELEARDRLQDTVDR